MQTITFQTNTIFISTEKYDYVGRLLKPGEDANDYSDVSDVEGPDKTDPDKDKDAWTVTAHPLPMNSELTTKKDL